MTTAGATYADPRSPTDVSGAPAPKILIVGDVIDDLIVQPLRSVTPASDTPARITPSYGGSAANQAVWVAAAGARARLVARVGAADLERHTSALMAAGVEPVLTADPERSTGRIVIVVAPDGERTMYTDRGANLALRVGDLPDELLEGVTAMHLSGYGLFDPGVRTAVLDLVARVRARGLPVSVDPGSITFLAEVGPKAFLGWVAGAALLLPNLDEGRLLTGTVDPEVVLDALLEHTPVVALTLGPAGVLLGARGRPALHLPAPDVEVVDTTGAGDAFAGAFLAAWLTGAGLRAAGVRGVEAAGRAVTVAGARPPRGGPPADLTRPVVEP
jgi:sugar/nucleoside kinase (ribokinase family)